MCVCPALASRAVSGSAGQWSVNLEPIERLALGVCFHLLVPTCALRAPGSCFHCTQLWVGHDQVVSHDVTSVMSLLSHVGGKLT